MRPKLSAFPKCFIEQIALDRTMSVFEWIEMARALDADGLELYEGFLITFQEEYLVKVKTAIADAGFVMPMLCCSPDFTHPHPDARFKEIARQAQMIESAAILGGEGVVCRVLSGQRHPGVDREQGLAWAAEAINQLVPLARDLKVVLGIENHYKDGFWDYPEFAQKQDVFLDLLSMIPDRRNFGVQYDPSNAVVAGDDPIALLEKVADRVVSMHASDRYLAEGATLDDLRQSDGTMGYSPLLRHGVIGKGLNDYDAIFSILAKHRYQGWISIEDGMNGMEEMAESLRFLRRKIADYFPDENH